MIAAIGGVGLVDQAAAAGSPAISSARKGAFVSGFQELAWHGNRIVLFEQDGAGSCEALREAGCGGWNVRAESKLISSFGIRDSAKVKT